MSARRLPADPGPLVLSCEHGGHRVPARWAHVLVGVEGILPTHRGWDRGALELARHLGRALDAPLVANRNTRLLADANRSEHNPRIFSQWSRRLPAAQRARLLDEVWRPYRERVEARVDAAIAARGRCLHVSVHTFTPVLRGVRREVDVGLLYDPSRPAERDLAGSVDASLRSRLPRLRVRRNRPYRGTDDGFLPHLRRVCLPGAYVGLELEVNQRFPRAAGHGWARVKEALSTALGA